MTEAQIVSWMIDNVEIWRPTALGVLTGLVVGLLWFAAWATEREW